MPTFLSGIDVTFDERRADLKLTQIRVPQVGDLALPRHTKITLTGTAPEGEPVLAWRYAPAFGDSLPRSRRHRWRDGCILAEKRRADPPIKIRGRSAQSFVGLAWQYVWVGFTHIIPLGLDHILFVLGLYFLSATSAAHHPDFELYGSTHAYASP